MENKTLKTENGIEIDVRSIKTFTENAKILEFSPCHYSSGDYVEGFQVDMELDATLADGTSESFVISCQSADTSNILKSHRRTAMSFAKRFGADWDESGELEEFVNHKDWDEIRWFLISLAEDLCKKWYSAKKGEATNE